MEGLGFLRARCKILLALADVALICAGLQIAGAREHRAIVPGHVGDSVSDEMARIQGLRLAPVPTTAPQQPLVTPIPEAQRASASLPIAGKGMWIWLFDQVERGDPVRIVRKARVLGLTHIYVHSSSTVDGTKFLRDIDRILPVAHAAGIRIIAWDFPLLRDPDQDVRRMVGILDHRTRIGDQVDGIAVDLETPAEGVSLTPAVAEHVAVQLQQLRPQRFRVLVPPRPTAWTTSFYPYGIIRHFDAVAPMVYWIDQDPIASLRDTIAFLGRFQKPIAPIGQAYDPGADGSGPRGAPNGKVLQRFAAWALRHGAVGVSFWSWQHANGEELGAIAKISYPIQG